MRLPALLLCLFFPLLLTFSAVSTCQAVQPRAFSAKKINKLQTGTKTRAEVEKILGKPVSVAPVQKTAEGCTEMWVYTEVLMDGTTLVATEVLYVGFNDEGVVCSVDIQ